MHVIYDVSHNIAKIEEHVVDGKQKTLLVHRKVKTKGLLVSKFAKLLEIECSSDKLCNIFYALHFFERFSKF